MANCQEIARGALFVSRFKGGATVDEEFFLATCAYIDLNSVELAWRKSLGL